MAKDDTTMFGILIDVYLKKKTEGRECFMQEEKIIQATRFVLSIDIFDSMDYLNS